MSSTLKKWLPAIVIVGGAIAFVLLAQPAAVPVNANRSGGALIAETPSYDFGALPLRSGIARTLYTVKNAGAESLVIKNVWTSCMCTEAMVRKGTFAMGPFGMPGHGGPTRAISLSLSPGESADVEALFDPAAHGPAGVGPVARSIFLAADTGELLELSFTAVVTP